MSPVFLVAYPSIVLRTATEHLPVSQCGRRLQYFIAMQSKSNSRLLVGFKIAYGDSKNIMLRKSKFEDIEGHAFYIL